MSKCAIVTGASRGLGLALTRRLSSEGWTVIVDSLDRRELENATFRLPGVHAIPGDVSDPYHQQILIEAARTTGRLDLLVNNASALGPTPLPALADANLRSVVRTFEVNVFAPLGLIQLALPLLAESEGAIVNVTSDAAVESYPGWGVYGASRRPWSRRAGCSPPSDPTSPSTGWTRATCGPACTRRRSAGRTSPTCRRRRTACRGSWS